MQGVSIYNTTHAIERTHIYVGLTASDSGFVAHLERCWLDATPDAWINDPSVRDTKGIAEFKCPYRETDMSLEEACQGSEFCCSIINGKMQLKRGHSYYHQVQLQLHVASDICSWCDFCIYTTKDIAVERIYADQQWVLTFCPQLDEYYFDHILPELVSQKYKPSYIL